MRPTTFGIAALVGRLAGSRAVDTIRCGSGTGKGCAAGPLHGARALLNEQESICRASGDGVGLGQALGNRAIVQRYTGELSAAPASLDEQLRLAPQTGNARVS